MLDADRRSAVWEQSGTLVVLNYAAVSFAVVVSLWGVRRISRRIDDLAAAMPDGLGGEPRKQFRELGSTGAPLTGSAATAVAFGVVALVSDGVAAGILRGATWFLFGVALWTFLWTYAALQVGLVRLGREHLRLDAARVDPALGLRPLGGLAFTGLWMLLVWLIPVLLTGLPDVAGFVIGMIVLAAALAAFFLSLVGLHRQMVEVKARELELARTLYADAYEPVRAEPTLEALQRQHTLLGAAEALEERAKAIHEWPIDEGTLARVVTITTSVIAMSVARLILDPFGL